MIQVAALGCRSPLGSLRCAVPRSASGWVAVARLSRSRSVLAIVIVAEFDPAPAASSTRSTRAGSRPSASATSSASTGSASSWSCSRPSSGSPRPSGRRITPRSGRGQLLPHVRAGRDRGARRLPRPGPDPVRPLLRPDADPVLLPVRELGDEHPDGEDEPIRPRPTDQDDRLHARRLAADAGRGDRHRDPRRRRRPRSTSRSSTSRQHLLGTGSQYWIFWFFAAAFLVKMPAFPLHGWMPDAYRVAPLPVLALLLGRALEGRRLRVPADRAADLPGRRRSSSRR